MRAMSYAAAPRDMAVQSKARQAYARSQNTDMTNALFSLFLLILLTRSSLDKVFGTVPFDIGTGNTITLGAGVNGLVIVMAGLLTLIHPNRVLWKAQLGWITFVSFCTIMSLGTADPIGVSREIFVLVSYQCVFMLPFFFARAAGGLKSIINAIIYSSLVPSVVAISQMIDAPTEMDGRIESTFTHPNIFAFYLLTVGAAIAYRIASPIFPDTLVRRVALLSYAGLLGIFLLATQTRSAWLAATILLFAYAIFVQRQALLIFIAFPFIVFFSPAIQERLLNTFTPAEYIGNGVVLNSYDWRLQLWRDALRSINEKPFSGHGGLGTFFEQSSSFFSLDPLGAAAHNVYIQLAFEVGIIGAILYFAVFAQKAWTLASQFRTDRATCVVGTSLCLTYLVLSYSDNMMSYLASNWYTFSLLGTLVASCRCATAFHGCETLSPPSKPLRRCRITNGKSMGRAASYVARHNRASRLSRHTASPHAQQPAQGPLL